MLRNAGFHWYGICLVSGRDNSEVGGRGFAFISRGTQEIKTFNQIIRKREDNSETRLLAFFQGGGLTKLDRARRAFQRDPEYLAILHISPDDRDLFPGGCDGRIHCDGRFTMRQSNACREKADE